MYEGAKVPTNDAISFNAALTLMKSEGHSVFFFVFNCAPREIFGSKFDRRDTDFQRIGPSTPTSSFNGVSRIQVSPAAALLSSTFSDHVMNDEPAPTSSIPSASSNVNTSEPVLWVSSGNSSPATIQEARPPELVETLTIQSAEVTVPINTRSQNLPLKKPTILLRSKGKMRADDNQAGHSR